MQAWLPPSILSAALGAAKKTHTNLDFPGKNAMAERGGFEPPVQVLVPYNGLANRRLKPLGHLSVDRLYIPRRLIPRNPGHANVLVPHRFLHRSQVHPHDNQSAAGCVAAPPALAAPRDERHLRHIPLGAEPGDNLCQARDVPPNDAALSAVQA